MRAAARDPKFAKANVPQPVAREFTARDREKAKNQQTADWMKKRRAEKREY